MRFAEASVQPCATLRHRTSAPIEWKSAPQLFPSVGAHANSQVCTKSSLRFVFFLIVSSKFQGWLSHLFIVFLCAICYHISIVAMWSVWCVVAPNDCRMVAQWQSVADVTVSASCPQTSLLSDSLCHPRSLYDGHYFTNPPSCDQVLLWDTISWESRRCTTAPLPHPCLLLCFSFRGLRLLSCFRV